MVKMLSPRVCNLIFGLLSMFGDNSDEAFFGADFGWRIFYLGGIIIFKKIYLRSKKEFEKDVNMYSKMYCILAAAVSDAIEKPEDGNVIKENLINAHLNAEEIFIGDHPKSCVNLQSVVKWN